MKKRILSLFMVALAITSFGISAGRAFAVDQVFYSGNNILFYNPDDTSCSTTSVATTGDNIGNAYNFFVSKGLTALQASAIIGNLKQESGLNPKALNSIGAYGIAQWLGGRKANLLKDPYYTSGATDPSKELQVQLNFLWSELQGAEKGAYTALTSSTSTDAGALALVFGQTFERYGSGEAGSRAKYAADVYTQYGSTTSTGTGACTQAGAGGFVYYSQKDPKWGDHIYGDAGAIKYAGCGPTSLAMIVATLADKTVTPVQTADLGAANGSAFSGGTKHVPLLQAAATKWGITYTDISSQPFDVAIQAVKEGKLVYMGGQGAAPFTSGGHVVVMRGVTPDGQIIIADPYRNAADVYSPQTVEAGRGSTFIISKGASI
ncbi:MAG: murein hydrolase [Candidatus Saccharibacteria bacterium]|nr:murein hydrolase [Candidatus Saccharibacteria bacterium]